MTLFASQLQSAAARRVYDTLNLKASSLEEAQRYCRALARSHYENFLVASVFLPSHLIQHYYNVYAYCRISDDLGDETGDSALSLTFLGQWEEELKSCYDGRPRHPIFVALRETVTQFEIPMKPFSDLLLAFKRDQVKKRYQSYEELLEYCRYSANPVGHLVLYLAGYQDAERRELSDKTCTALQLANHWQDIGRDLTRLDRIYLPAEDMDRFHYSEADLVSKTVDERFVALMQMEVNRARTLFQEGLRLRDLVQPSQAVDLELFGRCGLEILRRIEQVHFDVFRRRPTLTKWAALQVLVKTWWSNQFRK